MLRETSHRQKAIREAIEATVMDRLGGDVVASVVVEFNDDDEGVDFVTVKVIFTGKATSLDAKVMSALGRDIRMALDNIESYRFPVLRFISKHDYDHRRRAS